jgi:ABC-2 type transport system ATP-binding protein/lipopolysaccharide transport system ATP-binding protein
MYVRLGFSVAVHMDPDVLLVDEVLAVGDEEFQRKCFDYLYTLRKAGKTIVVVSHGLGQLESLCDEITWLDHGTVHGKGPSSQVIAAYLDQVNSAEAARNLEARAERPEELGADRAGSGQIRVRSIALTTPSGEPLQHAETGTTCTLKLDLQAYEPILGPNVRLAIQHEGGSLVSMVNNHRFGVDLGTVEGPFTVETDIVENPLLPARYRIHVDVFDHTGARLLDSWSEALDIAVRSPRGEIGQGFIDLKADFRIT